MNLEIPNYNLSIHVRGEDFYILNVDQGFFIDESNEKKQGYF